MSRAAMTSALRSRLLATAFGVIGVAVSLPNAAHAQAAPQSYTSATRYDALGRVTGTIAPDPDGIAPYAFIAVRNTYNAAGNLIKVEKGVLNAWQAETVAPANWGAAFTINTTIDSLYDTAGRKVRDTTSAGGTAFGVTQYSYDQMDRVVCTAVRMNPAVYGSLPSDACVLGTPGSQGNDRITRNSYFGAANLVSETKRAVGTALEQSYVRYTYTTTQKVETVTDARGLKATYTYDEYDRLKVWAMPSPTYAGTSSTTDKEEYRYDANGNLTERWLRDHSGTNTSQILYTFDALNRQLTRTPTGENAVSYGYDLRSLVTSEQRLGDGRSLAYTFDGFGRLLTEAQPYGTMNYQYDRNGNRTRVTWAADGLYAQYDYDQLGRMTAIRENGAASGIGVLAVYAYNADGSRSQVTYGNGTVRAYEYDSASRVKGVKIDLAGALNDLTIGQVAGAGSAIQYNPAGQVTSLTRSNDAYAWTAHSPFERDYAVNGLNQYTSAGSASFGYDGRGNLTQSGTTTYAYTRLNEFKSGPNPGGGTINLAYDPKGRLAEFNAAGVVTRLAYAGANLVTETGATGTILRRYVHGPGADEPVVWYEGAGATNRRWLQSDQLGSVVAVSDGAGAMLGINRYDEYGIPQAGNTGRFQYTGQTWWSELGMYNYKARWYSASLGRFLQVDPIGYKDQINLYAYVGNDPVNRSDPTGLYTCTGDKDFCNKVAAGVSQMRRAEWDARGGGAPNSASRVLGKTADTLGRQGDKNGVTIANGTLEKGTLGQAVGNSITLDQKQIEQGKSYIGDKWGAFSEVLAHEGTHVWYRSSKSQVDGILENERAGWRAQYYMMRYNMSENPLYVPVVPLRSGQSEGDYVHEGALNSCEGSGANWFKCLDGSMSMKW